MTLRLNRSPTGSLVQIFSSRDTIVQLNQSDLRPNVAAEQSRSPRCAPVPGSHPSHQRTPRVFAFQTSEEDERVEVTADVPNPGSEVPHMTLTEQLHNCQDLLARAQMAGDKDAIRRFSEHRLSLIQQMDPTSIDPTQAQQSSRY